MFSNFKGAEIWRGGQFLAGLGFELMALRFELGNVRRRRHGGASGGKPGNFAPSTRI